MIIEGRVAAGFEPVQRLYERNMRTLAERNTQLCVYVGEESVVDLWASAHDDPSFSGDSLINVFSSGKSLESIALAMLADRGLLDFAANITDYWPEFGANGKAQTTVADLMRHEAGMAAFTESLQADWLHPDQLKTNAVGRIVEAHDQKFREGPDNQREYHAITRGWIANELFRRVEPQGRTMGEFMRAEVSEPLDADVYIGLKDDELSRLSHVAMLGGWFQVGQGFIPRRFGRRMELNLAQTIAKVWRLRGGLLGRSRGRTPPPLAGMERISFFDSPAMAKGETPSAGAKCSARGLAKVAALMANGGTLGSQALLGERGWNLLYEHPVRRNMMALSTEFTQAGLAAFSAVGAGSSLIERGLNVGREGFFGWMGLGGSIFQWHPEKKIGFAYAPTSLNVLDIVNERGKSYQAEVLRCLA